MKTRPLATAILLTSLALTACTAGSSTSTPTVVPLPGSEGEPSRAQAVRPSPTVTPTPRPPTPTPMPTSSPTLTPQPATPSPTPVPAATPPAPQAEIVISALNVRQGPGVDYPMAGVALAGDVFDIIGTNSTGDWLQVVTADGGSGWISGKPAYTRVLGTLDGLAIVEVPPPPEPVASRAVAPGSGLSGKLVFMPTSGGGIYVVNADGTGLRRLASGGLDPALSPDGRHVAFTRWGLTEGLYVINVDGSGERQVVPSKQAKSPTWSPDGARIAFNMQRGGRLEVLSKCLGVSDPENPPALPPNAYDIGVRINQEDGTFDLCFKLPPDPYWTMRVAEVATGEYVDLASDNHSFAPAWDPLNAWRIVFDGDYGLVQLDANQNAKSVFTEDVRDHVPSFSPGGSRVAVSYKQHDHWEIHVMNADGSGRTRLTETSLRAIVEQTINGEEPRSWNNVSPTWSPDGSQIAFLSDRSGQWEIWVMSSDGSNQRPMFATGTLAGFHFQFNNVDERMISWGP